MKLKKAERVYFVQKDTPKRMDYRFGYNRTPESALKYHLAQWLPKDGYSSSWSKESLLKGTTLGKRSKRLRLSSTKSW